MKKLRYWIIDFLISLGTYLEYSSRIKQPKIKRFGMMMTIYVSWLRWQYVRKYYGEQDFGANIESPLCFERGILHKILIGKTLQ